MATCDRQTTFHIRQAFADLRQRAIDQPILPPLTRAAIAQDVQAVFAELDRQQLAITRQLSPAQRLNQVYELNHFLRQAIIAAIHQQQPDIDEVGLHQQLLARMGIHDDERTRV